MTGVPRKGAVAVLVVRWAARVLGVVVLAVVVRLLVGDWPQYGGAPPLADTVQFVALFATLCGHVLIWRWEGVGALVAIGGASCFLTVGYAGYGSMPPSFALLYLPGVLAAICWWLTTAEGHVGPLRTLLKRPIVLTIVVVELTAGILVGLCFVREAMPRGGVLTGGVALLHRPAALGGPVSLSGKALRRHHLEIQRGWEETCEKSAKAVEINPRDATAYYDWGVALANQGRFTEACEKLAKTVEINPRHALAYDLWGFELRCLGRRTEACEKFAKTVEINPRNAYAYYNWGVTLRLLGRDAEVCEKFAKAVEINPRFWQAYYDWGIALAEMGKPADACEKYAKAVEINPRHGKAYGDWGNALVKMGKPAEACEKFAKAVEIDPRDANAYYYWGTALAHMGKRAEAEQKWRKAVVPHPEPGKKGALIEEARKQLLGKE